MENAKDQKITTLESDIQQLQKFISLSERPKVQQFLKKHLTHLQNQLKILNSNLEQEKKKIAQQVENQRVQPQVVQKKSILYTPISKYSWQDEGKKVKIYITLQGIANQCPQNNIQFNLLKNSVQVKVHNYKKQNLMFAIKKTFSPIVPEQSKHLIKSNMIVITLVKQSSGIWSQLNFKEDKFKLPKEEKAEDPNASIMNMMKKMYQEGDDTMKKTIAEAWTKSRKGKQPNLG